MFNNSRNPHVYGGEYTNAGRDILHFETNQTINNYSGYQQSMCNDDPARIEGM